MIGLVLLLYFEANLNVLAVEMSKASDINMSETIATLKKKAEFEKSRLSLVNATQVKHNDVVVMWDTIVLNFIH